MKQKDIPGPTIQPGQCGVCFFGKRAKAFKLTAEKVIFSPVEWYISDIPGWCKIHGMPEAFPGFLIREEKGPYKSFSGWVFPGFQHSDDGIPDVVNRAALERLLEVDEAALSAGEVRHWDEGSKLVKLFAEAWDNADDTPSDAISAAEWVQKHSFFSFKRVYEATAATS